MAKITMDVSEYETIMETKRLLEDSLKKERELESTIKKLTQEKLKALEDAKMKVVKITKSEVNECLLTRKPVMEILGSLLALSKRGPDLHYLEYRIDDIERMFFVKSKLTQFPTETTTLHGLDEVKEEIKRDIEKEYKSRIEDAEKLQDDTYNLKREKERLLVELEHVNVIKEKLESSYDSMIKEKDELVDRTVKEKDDLVSRLTKIKELTKALSNANFFTAYSKIQKLKTLLN